MQHTDITHTHTHRETDKPLAIGESTDIVYYGRSDLMTSKALNLNGDLLLSGGARISTEYSFAHHLLHRFLRVSILIDNIELLLYATTYN